MALSIGLIIFLGLLSGFLFSKIKLPALLGMLLVGIIIGPHSLNLLDKSILNISADLRKIALIIILIRAGLGIKSNDIKQVGKTAFLMSFIPGLLEGFAIAFVSIKILDFDFITGGILGFIIAAVSPAVIVPLMLKYIDIKLGMKKSIPVLILAAASIDDVFAITIFSSFLGLYANKNFNIGLQLLNIPISIIIGVLLGLVIGIILIFIFNKFKIRDSKKVLIMLSLAIFMVTLEKMMENYFAIASLLGVMALGFIITEKKPELGARLSLKFNKIWVFAELFLFVLVGAEVDLNVAIKAGLIGLILIIIGLIARSIGVFLSTIKSNLNFKERLFCVISYWPKATVQAAIGSIPLTLGVNNGDVILAIAVLSIIITAPIGAIMINLTSTRLLSE